MLEPHEFRIPEYDDGYDCATSFERAHEDQPDCYCPHCDTLLVDADAYRCQACGADI